TVASPEAVQGLLDLYDWTDDSAQRRSNLRRRKGLERVRWASKEVLYRGSIIRGAEVILQIRDEQFVSTGDLCLFGSVMSAFLSMYATVNSFVHLTIETIPASERYTWSPKHGARATL
ncbi:MAG: type VI secretion system baseplate subunit TssF, partial [Bacteroidota bacterium]